MLVRLEKKPPGQGHYAAKEKGTGAASIRRPSKMVEWVGHPSQAFRTAIGLSCWRNSAKRITAVRGKRKRQREGGKMS